MKEKIIQILHKKTSLPKPQLEKLIEIPPRPELGDFAFPCFILSKTLKKPPTEIALELTREIKSKDFEKIQNNGPYINFFLDKKQFTKEILSKALQDEFGTSKQNRKILLEHTSVNPNASPHVGRARNSIIGDSIARILRFKGNKVETHYYINNVSKQVAMLALEYKPGDKFENLLSKYISAANKIKTDKNFEQKVFNLLHKFENKDRQTTALFNKVVDIAIKGQKQIFENFGIKFDTFDCESKYIGKPSQDLLKKFQQTNKLFKDKDERWVLDQKNSPLIKKMKSPVFVLARSNNTGLYGLRDIAYTIDKLKHGENIIILGEDQKLYFEQVAEALKLLEHHPPQVVHYSFVLIQDEKGTKKMSTRKGELVLLEEFFSQAVKKAKQEIEKRQTKGDAKKIALGAIKYAMLKNDNDKNIIFSWEHSLNFEGESGPYLQYSYARANSILKKAKTKKSQLKINEINEKEYTLIKKISQFPEIVDKASNNLNPSTIAHYSFELAQSFNEFYHSSHVIGDKNESFRLKLVEAFIHTIKKSLNLLGIEVIKQM